MRASGGCTMQQSLTAEAASIVSQAINLARRRGHAQVTPIHVARVMLVSPAALLQTACLKSNSHPLQYKALELCFNVALNRLPTTAPSPILAPHNSSYPSLSNALVAAFKRAQAHQRRGTLENQEQPILALKIEAEQLVISILDDPSVSRVMREAGFSSTQVKTNVEQQQQQATSLEVTSQNPSTTPLSSQYFSSFLQSSSPFPLDQFESAFRKQSQSQSQSLVSSLQAVRDEDVMGLMSSLVSKRKKNNTVVVGECVGACEGVVRAVKERIERGDVLSELRHVQFLNLPLMSIKSFTKEEVELKLGELRCLVKGCLGRRVILYLGDFKWVSEYWSFYGEQRKSFYCPVEHMVQGLRRLLSGNSGEDFGRLRILGIANFNSYIKCKAGHPSLESLLDLHPLAVPVGSLDFSLKLDSSFEVESKSVVSGENYGWSLQENRSTDMHLSFCSDCSANFHKEARDLAVSVTKMESTTTSTSSSLPSWLQKCKEEITEETTCDQKGQGQIKELCKKWNSICKSIHKTISFSSASPSPCNSISSYDQKTLQNLHDMKLGWPTMLEPKWVSKEHNFLISKPELLSNPNSTPNSASSSETTEMTMDKAMQFKDNTAENLETLCSGLERKAPWHREIIPDIATTVLRCRSGMVKRKDRSKNETWLFFSGGDEESKVKVAKELAKLIFGSHRSFKSVGISSFSSPTRADSTDDPCKKRGRDESGDAFLERFGKAVRDDPHRVFYVEDVEQVDHFSQKGVKRAIESGKITLLGGEEVFLEDAIVIFSCESFSSTSRACSPSTKQKTYHEYDVHDHESGKKEEDEDDDDDSEEASSSCVALDLNLSTANQDAELGILESVDRQIVFKLQGV